VFDTVKEWNIGNVDALEGPKDEAATCTGMCCTFFPEPYVIQNSSTGSVLTTERARTITSQGRRSVFLSWAAENERRRREFVGGSGGIPPPKILKYRGSEIVFTAFSARYFLK